MALFANAFFRRRIRLLCSCMVIYEIWCIRSATRFIQFRRSSPGMDDYGVILLFITKCNLDSWARIFISVLFFIDTVLILLIAKKYYNRIVGIIAVLVFGASASIIPFERLILLDNIGIVFILAAFLLFLPKPESNPDNQLRISPNPWSGLLVAIAILVKYPFVVFIPGFIIFFYVQTHSTYNLKIKFEFFQDVKRWFKVSLLFIVPFLLYLVFILSF